MKFILGFWLMLVFNSIFGQCINGQYILEDNGLTHAQSIDYTDDGGFVIAGYTTVSGAGQEDIFITKFDNQNNIEWSNTYGTSSKDSGFPVYIINTPNGYLISCQSGNFSNYGGLTILNLDFNGAILWQKKVSNQSHYSLSIFASVDNNGDYLLSGSVAYNSAGSDDAYLLKLDNSGNIIWSKTFGTPTNDHSFCTIQTSDNGYIYGAHSRFFGIGDASKILIKTDINGTYQWSKYYDQSNDASFYDYQIAPDGNIYAVGLEINGTDQDFSVTKLDQNGNLIWSKRYAGANNETGNSIEILSNGDLFVSGTSNSFGSGGNDLFISKLDGNGDEIWTKFYGGALSDELIQHTIDPLKLNETSGKLYLIGNTKSFGNSDLDPYIIITDLDGNSDCNSLNANWTITTENPVVGNAPYTSIGSIGSISNSNLNSNPFLSTLDTLCINVCDTVLIDTTIIKPDTLFQNCITMPTAFSPNGDNLNDKLYPIFKINEVAINEFRIYNRWGEEIHNGNFAWDGKYKNKDQAQEIYIYFIKYTCYNEVKQLIGNVTLIR